MITPMKKITLISLASARDGNVSLLRDLGVLHVELSASPEEASSKTQAAMDTLAKAIAIVAATSPSPSMKSDYSPEEIAEKILALQKRITDLSTALSLLQQEKAKQEPLGDFNIEQAQALIAQGIAITLFRIPQKCRFPEGDGFARLGLRDKFIYGAAFNVTPDDPLAEILPLPHRSLGDINAEIRKVIADISTTQAELHRLAGASEKLSERIKELTEKHAFQRVAESMSAHGAISTLEGYCPDPKIKALEAAAKEHGWALLIRDPAPDDNVPVHLKLPRWLQPITLLFKGLGILPGYTETDVSAAFLFFFSIFFAMIIGDAGYGLLLLTGVSIAALKIRKPSPTPYPLPPTRSIQTQALWLFGVLAVCTIIWGALTGNYFAIASENLPAFMQGVPWLKVDNNMMWLCFIFGAVHLSVAHLWNAIVLFPSGKAYAQLGWVGFAWFMFFIAGMLVVNRPMPNVMWWIGGISMALVLLFSVAPKDIKEEWTSYPIIVINFISCLGDIISYIRLFAIGMASVKIAMTFNDMALGLGSSVWVKALAAPIILMLGHGLNIALGALAVLVHAVRLNILEFSNHKGVSWSGQPYSPFATPPKKL